MTVRLVVFLLERSLVELTLTERAREMLRVIFAIHRRDTAAGDGLVTAGT